MESPGLSSNLIFIRPLYKAQEGDRVFSGFGTVEIKDNQGDIVLLEDNETKITKVLDTWMKRGGIILDEHSNRHVGTAQKWKWAIDPKTNKKGIYLNGRIFNDYSVDNRVWDDIRRGNYSGFSLGGRAVGERTSQIGSDQVNEIPDLEIWEFSVCRDPANPAATIDNVNYKAKGAPLLETQLQEMKKADPERGDIETLAHAVGYSGDLHEFELGMEHEREHDDITGGDPLMTAKLVMPHLKERGDYYSWLSSQEGDSMKKARTYISGPGQAPKGVQIQQGPRGGAYYESGGEKQPATKQPEVTQVPKSPKTPSASEPKTPKDEMTPEGEIPFNMRNFIEGQLLNDESSTDTQMISYFIENGLSKEQAEYAVSQREEALKHPMIFGLDSDPNNMTHYQRERMATLEDRKMAEKTKAEAPPKGAEGEATEEQGEENVSVPKSHLQTLMEKMSGLEARHMEMEKRMAAYEGAHKSEVEATPPKDEAEVPPELPLQKSDSPVTMDAVRNELKKMLADGTLTKSTTPKPKTDEDQDDLRKTGDNVLTRDKLARMTINDGERLVASLGGL